MNRFRGVEHLETVFIEKLSEKFKLNERDLKKAFIRFDTNKNGLLDMDELRAAVKAFVNGAPDDQVDELMQAYDRSGDGKISYEELLHALETRSATRQFMKQKQKKLLEDSPPSQSRAVRAIEMRPANNGNTNNGRAKDSDFEIDENEFEDSTGEDNFSAEGDFDRGAYATMKQVGGRGGDLRVEIRNSGANSRASDSSVDSSANKMSVVETFDENLIENKVKSYLRQLKLYLSNSAKTHAYGQRDGSGRGGDGYDNVFGIATSGASVPVTKTDRLTNSHADLVSKVSREMLFKAFEPFTGPPPFTKYLPLVNFSQFSKALRSIVVPGTTLKTNMLEFLFDLVIEYSRNPIYSMNNIFRDNDNNDSDGLSVIDVRILVDVFLGNGKDKQSYVEHSRERESIAGPLGGHSTVGFGPIKKPTATEANNTKISQRVAALVGADNNGKAPAPMSSSKVAGPLKFVSRRSRACLTVPTGFDEEAWIRRSSQLPDYKLTRDHVFGMSGALQSGNSFHLVPSSVIASRNGTSRRTANAVDSSAIIYPSAAMGVVHDLATNKQVYFDGHTDDITAMASSILTSSSILVATGSVGKYPDLLLWKFDSTTNVCQQVGLVKREIKLFSRSVTLITISGDCNYMFAIGGDDHHTMFVFSLRTVLDFVAGGCIGEPVHLESILETSTQSGIPPMIKNSAYCSYFDYCDYIDRDHAGVCDVFCTVGERHIRLWSFKRPNPDIASKPSLKFRSPVPGKVSENLAPKTYTCCAFVPPSTNPSATRVSDLAMGDSPTGIDSCDLVAGGSNGLLFLYRKGAYITHNKVIKGGVSHIVSMSDKLVCGGAKCVIKIVDAKTLNIVQTFDGYGSLAALANRPLPSTRAGNLSSSASTAVQVMRGRPSSASLGGGGSARSGIRRPSDASSVSETRSVGTATSSRASRPNSATSSIASRASSKSSTSSLQQEGVSDLDDIETITITGLAVIPAGSRSSSPHAIVTLSSGVAFKVDLSSSGASVSAKIWTASEKSNNPLISAVKPLFYFHTNDICGVATDTNRSTSSTSNTPSNNGGYIPSVTNRVAATTGDDRRLCLWNISTKTLMCRTLLESAGKCCAFDRSNCFVAVGCSLGSFFVYAITLCNSSKSEFPVALSQKSYRKDSQEDINDIKISPSNNGLVCGGRDNNIYVYTLALSNHGLPSASVSISPVMKLSGHTSFIRQLDYSSDGKLLLSTCGAHELLCWQLPTADSPGGLAMGTNISDISWKTNHCIFGFSVMGIWPSSNNNNNKPYDGTDINGIDVCREKGLVVVADDFGKVSLLNYPCIIEDAPSRVYTGHSSHVSGIRVSQGYDKVVSIGSHDQAVVLWRFEEPSSERNVIRRSNYTNLL